MARNTIDYISDWATRLRSRLYTQFRDAVTWNQWVDEVLAPQIQDLEDSGQTILTILDIDNSEGVQLDVIGRFVGQSRLGSSDVVYRTLIKAKVLVNRSTGTSEDIYAAMRVLLDSPSMVITTFSVKTFLLRMVDIITAAQAALAITFLTDAKEAGARGLLEWQEYSNSNTFTFGIDALTTTAIVGGVAFLAVNVASTADYPATGTIYIDYGTPIQEQFIYTSKTSTSFVRGILAAMVWDHPAGSEVGLSGSILGEGLGFGDAADASVGGRLTGAAQV